MIKKVFPIVLKILAVFSSLSNFHCSPYYSAPPFSIYDCKLQNIYFIFSLHFILFFLGCIHLHNYWCWKSKCGNMDSPLLNFNFFCLLSKFLSGKEFQYYFGYLRRKCFRFFVCFCYRYWNGKGGGIIAGMVEVNLPNNLVNS